MSLYIHKKTQIYKSIHKKNGKMDKEWHIRLCWNVYKIPS